MKKIIALCSTRSYYEYIPVIIQSIVYNNPHIDHIYIIGEDNNIENLQQFKDKISIINFHNSSLLLTKDNPNYSVSYYSWGCLMPLWFTELLPEIDQLLYIDIDTVVDDCIEELWDIDMTNYCLAMCKENGDKVTFIQNNKTYIYGAAGVVMFNLKRLKETGKDKEMLHQIFTKRFQYIQQDVMNFVCAGEIFYLSPIYNTWCARFIKIDKPKIIHYVRPEKKPWLKRTPETELWWKYKDMLDNK